MRIHLCLALFVATFWSCKEKQTPQFQLRDAVADAPEFNKIKLSLQADPGAAKIFGKFSYSDSTFKAGDVVTLKYDVISNGSSTVLCSSLRKSRAVTLKGVGEVGTFELPLSAKDWTPPMQPDPKDNAKWDMADERLWNGPMRVEGCFLNKQGQPMAMAAASPSSFNLQAGASGAINLHGDQCAAKLGPIPPFDCLDDTYFKTIPITVTDSEGTARSPGNRVETCDSPIYLPTGGHGSCKPWARLGKIPTGDNTFAAVICRRYWPEGTDRPNADGAASGVPAEFFTTNPAVAIQGEGSWKKNPSSEDDPFFNDVAIVQHNSDTGETCFFQALGVLYGSRVPPPTEREVPEDVAAQHPYAKNAGSFWLTPDGTANINCINCHDADAWMHSPYVRAVKGDDGSLHLPSTWEMSWPDKYIIIGQDFGFQDWTTSYTVTPTSDDSCVGCHEIGSLAGCERWVEDIGSGRHFAHYKTLYGKAFPRSHWMPPDFTETEADWERMWRGGQKAIADCCNVQDDDGQKILGVAGEFSGSGRYGKSLNERQIAKLEAAGCEVRQRSFIE